MIKRNATILTELEFLWKATLSLCFKHICVLCKKHIDIDQEHICNECKQMLSYLPTGCCKRCAHPLPPVYETRYTCPNCTGRKFYYRSMSSLFMLDTAMKNILHQIKYYKKFWLIEIFHEDIKNSIHKKVRNTAVDYIIPIPLSSIKMVTRGFNQAEMIARRVSIGIQKPILNNVLRKRSNISQATLSRNQRLTNPQGTFMIRRANRIAGKDILLTDDIYTTGSTVNECARILKENGARSINVFTLARTI